MWLPNQRALIPLSDKGIRAQRKVWICATKGAESGRNARLRKIICRVFLCLLPLLILPGCGNRIPVTPVTGTITLNGAPVENAMVTFIPDSSGTVATATTDKTGKYILKTYRGDKTALGAFPGGYKVTVVKRVQTDFPESDFENLTPEKEAELMNKIDTTLKGRAPNYKYLVPKKYESQQTSGLTAEVPTKGKTACDFDLED